MQKEKLLSLVEDPKLISGIYNYCNRWCERCPFTSRCMQYRMEAEEARSYDSHSTDEDNARFWERLSASFSLAIELIQDFARRKGIDLNELDVEASRVEQEKQRESVRRHVCSQMASEYSAKVNRWFDASGQLWGTKRDELASWALISVPGLDPAQEAFKIADAAEIIRWYQDFIYAKTSRALQGKLQELPEELEQMPKDFDGSAKVAMIAIDHSMSAWATVLDHFPGEREPILDMLTRLLRLKKSLESIFPNSHAFIRPGFDE